MKNLIFLFFCISALCSVGCLEANAEGDSYKSSTEDSGSYSGYEREYRESANQQDYANNSRENRTRKSKSIYSNPYRPNSGEEKDEIEDPNHRDASSEAENTAMSDIYSKLVELEEKLRSLNGKIQMIEHENAKILEKLNKAFADSSYRISSLEAKELEKTMLSELSDYRKMISDKKYKQAVSGLLQYVKNNKNKMDLDEVYYLLGEAYMKQGFYDKAGTYFLRNYKHYPNNPYVVDSLLNTAKSLINLHKNKGACKIFTRLTQSYEDRISPENAKYIEEKRQKLKCNDVGAVNSANSNAVPKSTSLAEK